MRKVFGLARMILISSLVLPFIAPKPLNLSLPLLRSPFSRFLLPLPIHKNDDNQRALMLRGDSHKVAVWVCPRPLDIKKPREIFVKLSTKPSFKIDLNSTMALDIKKYLETPKSQLPVWYIPPMSPLPPLLVALVVPPVRTSRLVSVKSKNMRERKDYTKYIKSKVTGICLRNLTASTITSFHGFASQKKGLSFRVNNDKEETLGSFRRKLFLSWIAWSHEHSKLKTILLNSQNTCTFSVQRELLENVKSPLNDTKRTKSALDTNGRLRNWDTESIDSKELKFSMNHTFFGKNLVSIPPPGPMTVASTAGKTQLSKSDYSSVFGDSSVLKNSGSRGSISKPQPSIYPKVTCSCTCNSAPFFIKASNSPKKIKTWHTKPRIVDTRVVVEIIAASSVLPPPNKNNSELNASVMCPETKFLEATKNVVPYSIKNESGLNASNICPATKFLETTPNEVLLSIKNESGFNASVVCLATKLLEAAPNMALPSIKIESEFNASALCPATKLLENGYKLKLPKKRQTLLEYQNDVSQLSACLQERPQDNEYVGCLGLIVAIFWILLISTLSYTVFGIIGGEELRRELEKDVRFLIARTYRALLKHFEECEDEKKQPKAKVDTVIIRERKKFQEQVDTDWVILSGAKDVLAM
mmetsp:Transcript_14317/g.21747  ORF Transcript_14317/g.21747 Transcript_14317/m.21747 type:complete len:643 (-) Transcript_14317:77-2005(-)